MDPDIYIWIQWVLYNAKYVSNKSLRSGIRGEQMRN